MVKLIESDGREGQYCALSHCWGAADKRPLRTTQANLHSHLTDIPFTQLPKTFKDAVLLTRSIGIDYLWIDSLCIVQDNTQDWLSEAKRMGDVYRDAYLVIAAAGANDATEGLFISERPRTGISKVPYTSEGATQGTFNICSIPLAGTKPEHGPLHTRAWAYQEKHLAQRIMFFMPNKMFWQCGTYMASEKGTSVGVDDYSRDMPWPDLLSEYTSKRLTKSRDRLYALRGIVDKVQKLREDDFRHEYGVWADGLHEQLLWRQTETVPEDESLDIPTWSWASIGGRKIWCVPHYSILRHLP